jgi:hypothetical protein
MELAPVAVVGRGGGRGGLRRTVAVVGRGGGVRRTDAVIGRGAWGMPGERMPPGQRMPPGERVPREERVPQEEKVPPEVMPPRMEGGGLGGGGGVFGGGGSEMSATAEDSVWFEGGRRSWVFSLWGVVGVSEAGELRPLEIVEKAHGIRGGFGRRF